MNCPACGTENLPGSKFCRECAAPLSAGCPNCGFVNMPNSKFCAECATPLLSGAAGRIAPPVSIGAAPTIGSGAERKLVSIVFADLVGFTPYAEERDSEDVRETLTRYFDLAREVIGRYGGTVEKFIGDAVMAVWGAPVAHEDDAERAVRAALELVDAVQGMGPGIQARAGVLTGEAAVTIGATNQGMVAGDLVNTASRLQSVAPPGAVLVGESTQRATNSSIAFEPAGEQVLKGKQAPVAAWRALRVVAEVGGRNRALGLEPPFVGRQDEMRLLKDLFHATGREKKLRVVSVIGPAGIGKSRLTWEFSKYIDGVIDLVYWHSGRSPAYGEGITFWALGEMIRERCQLAESDDEQTTRAKVGETVAQWVTDPEEAAWIERSLLTLLGVESGMASDQLFGAWRTFFERIAQKGSVVLAFEDMHFADTGLLDFVDHLLEWSRGLPIYVVTLARPDLIERRPSWGAGKRNFVSLYLEPLPEADMRQLLTSLVPGLPETAVATIVGRADGIPMYAVETVRMLVAEGRLVEEDGVYVPRGDLTTLAVPETLQALIASRLDALDETERRIVHDAAVIGQSFTLGALSAVAGVAESELEPKLTSLVRRELLQREMDARSPERGQYAFVQALIREVAYNTLSKKDRKKLHLAAARYFESLGNDELAGVLASHYLAAHANAAEGAEADALGGQARIALRAAATRAGALGSHDQAVTFLEQALMITTDPADRAELMLQAAENSRLAGRLERDEQLAREALELARSANDGALAARAIRQLGEVLIGQFRNDEAQALLEPALDEFAVGDPAVISQMRLQLSRVHYGNSEFVEARDIIERVLETAEPLGLVDIIVRAFLMRGNVLWSMRRRLEAVAVSEAGLQLAADNGLIELQIRVMSNLANALIETDAAAAATRWRELLALTRKTGSRGLLIGGVGNFGYAAFLSGDWAEALTEMDAILAEDIAARDRLITLNNALIIRVSRGEPIEDGLAEMHRLAADMSGFSQLFVADPEANRAMAMGEFKKARDEYLVIYDADPGQPEYAYRAARAALWARDAGDATALLERIFGSGAYGPVADARIAAVRAGIAALEGRATEALALYRDALRGFDDSHSVWDRALTGIDMAELLDTSREPEVAAAIHSTRDILERLGAKPYLERLDAAASRAPARPARTVRSAAVPEGAVSE